MTNHYKTLGLHPQATDKEVKIAYREAAKKYHPDHALLNKQVAHEMMVLVNAAYEVLGDPSRKKEYDKSFGSFDESQAEQAFTDTPRYKSAESKAHDELIKYCKKFGVSETMAMNVWRVYGLASLWQLQNDPFYCIATVKRFTLAHAEKLGEHIPKDDRRRLRAYLLIAVKELLNGDTYVELDKLKKTFKSSLMTKFQSLYFGRGGKVAKNPAKKEQLTAEFKKRLEDLDFDKCLDSVGESIIIDGNTVQTKILYNAEMELVKLVLSNETFEVENIDGIADNLNDEQRQAVINSHKYKYSVLIGGPGTGKTETIKSIVRSHRVAWSGSGKSTLIICPTGKAAKRATQLTGYKAITAHSFILSPRYIDLAYSLKCLIVDETSMLDVFIAARIIRFIKRINPHCHIVKVGDAYQLKSVDAGAVLRDIQTALPTTELIKNYRQGAGSIILENAGKIAQGDTDLFYQDGVFERVRCDDFFDMYDYIASLENIHDWTIITPLNGTFWGVNALNFFAQKWHNEIVMDRYDPTSAPPKIGLLTIKNKRTKAVEVVYNKWKNTGDVVCMRSDFQPQFNKNVDLVKNQIGRIKSVPRDGQKIKCTFIDTSVEIKNGEFDVTFSRSDFEKHVMFQKVLRPGDKVMFLKNDPIGSRGKLPPLVNGDVGTVTAVTGSSATCEFNGYSYRLSRDKQSGNIEHTTLAYAFTCHKMQGGETDNIIIVLPNGRYTDRWWLRTAETRAKKQVVILDYNSLEAVIKRQLPPRKTRFKELLKIEKEQRARLLEVYG